MYASRIIQSNPIPFHSVPFNSIQAQSQYYLAGVPTGFFPAYLYVCAIFGEDDREGSRRFICAFRLDGVRLDLENVLLIVVAISCGSSSIANGNAKSNRSKSNNKKQAKVSF